MKKSELNKLRGKTVKELEDVLGKNRNKLELDYAKNIAGKGGKNLKTGKNLRKDIAQILTILREKEILEQESKKIEKDTNSKKS